ncbi:unnamed protein product [Adineta ricciae]|uniref:G-protein coupled receptors family 1 profile domain-containing protein n=1 Tax=Adineta ricciae TaxID=249248 RepID=A0A814FNN2_ADIRI|nr:unnamed protein product [Adineta ricciae]
MSSTSATAAYISSLQYTSGEITLSMSIVILVSGIVGNVLNCFVFTQQCLRSKPCVLCFLLASIFNLIAIVSGVPPRALQSWFMISDQTETVPVLCKLRIFVLFTSRTIASWLLSLATIDRYLISSRNLRRRQLSTRRNVFLSMLIISILSLLFWAETIYCFDANLVGTPQKCYAKSDTCRVFNDLSQSLITTVIPVIVIFIFGLFTISHVRDSRKIQVSQITATNNSTRRNKKDERSLTLMLVAQCLLLTIFTFPQAVQKCYLTYTFYQTKSSTQKVLESLLFNFVLLLTYIPSCMPFYLYTITGTVFRKTLITLVKKITCSV